jgi:Fur family transcriptional regulator, zinc uptake regulator
MLEIYCQREYNMLFFFMEKKMQDEKKNKAIDICIKNNESITPNRLLILDILSATKLPISAYDIHAIVKEKGKNLNISSVYRVIEFWAQLKVLHKISFLNKYILCDNTEEKHTHITNICTSCLTVIETCNKAMGLNLEKSSKNLGLILSPNMNIEIPVICESCQ